MNTLGITPPVFAGGSGATTPGIVAFWVLFYGWALSELYIGWRFRVRSGATPRDQGSRFAVIGSVWGGIVVGFGLAFALPAAAITTGRSAVFIAGLVLLAAGFVLRWYAIWVLGRSFTVVVATRPDQQVVEAGPYRWVRHPSYTGSLLTIAGVLLCLVNVASLFALIIPLAGYAYRIRVEEDALVRSLGEPYRAYMRRTRRLIPFLV
jgi:protein-S-isoprenylcysteine O-methyltransferase Ste14